MPTHTCSKKLCEEEVKELRNEQLRLEMDLKAGQSKVKSEIEKRRELEEKVAKLTQENEDIRRRLETATCGGSIDAIDTSNGNG